MPLEWLDFTAVVNGHWNRAIFTPAWIKKNLFDLGEDLPIEVQVPLDEYGPYLISHGNIVVIPASNRLTVKAASNKFDDLAMAAATAAKAIRVLPRTPLSAAGINVAFASDEPIGNCTEITTHGTDTVLADIDCAILKRGSNRTLKWGSGELNLAVDTTEDGKNTIQFNFHLSDKSEDNLIDWLDQSIEELKAIIENIFDNYIGLKIYDTPNGRSE